MADNGWFPRHNLLGEVASGYAQVTHDGKVILDPGFKPRWLNNETIVALGASDALFSVEKSGANVQKIAESAFLNTYGAGGGQWSVPDSKRGEILVEHDLVTGKRLVIVEHEWNNNDHSVIYDGQPIIEHVPAAEARVFDDVVMWKQYPMPTRIFGFKDGRVQDLRTMKRDWEGNPVPIKTDEGWWFLFVTNVDIRIRRWDKPEGYIIHTGVDMNFNPDAIGLGNVIRVGWQDRFGNRSSKDISILQETRIDVSTPLDADPIDPDDTEEEETPVAIPNHFHIVQRIDNEHPHLIKANNKETIREFYWRAAWALHQHDPKWGMLTKSAGENHQVINDLRVSVDAVAYKDAVPIVDILTSAGDGPNTGGITWGVEEHRRESNLWVAPPPFEGEDSGEEEGGEEEGGEEEPDNSEVVKALARLTVEVAELKAAVAELKATSLRYGSGLALRTDNGHLVCAEGGGGGEVNATRTRAGGWETFTTEKP
jgi:hypothetical protein